MPDLPTRAVLEHNFLFRGLSDRAIDSMARLARRQRFAKGELIFSQGDAGDALYGIASGKVRIFTADQCGHEAILNILGPGETFGEIALLDGLERTASALAIESSLLVVIPRPVFLEQLSNDPEMLRHVMKLLCERLRWVGDRVEELAFLSGPARVAKRVVGLAETFGRPIEGGGIELVISQAELGQFLGVSRQVVNQHVKCWSEQGWVVNRRGRIIVHDLDALRELFA